MDRRTAIKRLSLLGGSLLLLPGCTFSSERVSVALENLDITAAQQKLLSNIVDTFIPATDLPGASDLNVHHFVLVMVDDCQDKANQKAYSWGLEQIDDLSNNLFNCNFEACSTFYRQDLLNSIHNEDGRVKKIWGKDFGMGRKFATITKQYTIQGFLESEYVMTEVNPYQLVPGHFDGCVPLKQDA